jgi:hypothetical protein
MEQAWDIINNLAITAISLYLIFCTVLLLCLLFSLLGELIKWFRKNDKYTYKPPEGSKKNQYF